MASSRTNRPRVHITGIGIYRSGFSKYFTINPLKLSGETIELPDTNCGNGSVTTFLRNHLVITYNGVQLTSDDYSITSLRCSAGNEILGFSISYKQNYSGTRQMTSVKRCDLSDIPEQIFSGNAVTPKPTVKYGSATLQEGTDYVLSWADNTKTGTGSVTVTGINKYFASQTLTFKISAPAPTVTPTPKPTATPTPKPTNTPTPKPTSTPAPKPSGTPAPAVVKLTAPAIKASTSWNSCTLRWNRINNARSYILYRKTNSGKYAKIKTLNANTTSYKDTKITIGNKYSYVIRASRKTSSGYIYSPTSKAVTVKPNLLRPSTKLKTLKGKQILSWKKVPGATGYVLYQKKGNGSFKKVKTVSARNLNYTFKTSKNTTYSYRVVPYRTINRKAKTGPASAVKTGKAR